MDHMNSQQPLEGKVGVVFGVANKRSIAWAIAKAWHQAGAKLLFNYQGERVKENVEELTSEFGSNVFLHPCDVSCDKQIATIFEKVREHTPKLDLLLHSVAFAPKEALENDFITTSREAFLTAHNISAYSLIGLAREAALVVPAHVRRRVAVAVGAQPLVCRALVNVHALPRRRLALVPTGAPNC